MPDRVSGITSPVMLIPVKVLEDWGTASNAALDIFRIIKMPIAGGGAGMNLDTFVHLWEGPDDDNDFACLKVTSAGVASWADMDNDLCDFSSAPAKGSTVYIIGVTFVK